MNIVFVFYAKRESGLTTVTTDLDYFYLSEDLAVSEDRLYWLTRYERAIRDSAWSWFGDSWVEYDRFEDFDLRIGLHAGLGVLLYDTGRSKLKGRFGLGTSRKFGSPDDQWKPEAFLGADYECRLNDRQKITITSTYYADVGDAGSFRWNTKASWQCVIDEENNLAMKISAFDRWDSTPSSGEQPNDIDYWLSVLWGF